MSHPDTVSARARRRGPADTAAVSSPGHASGGRRARRTAPEGRGPAPANAAPVKRATVRAAELTACVVASLLIICLAATVLGAASFAIYTLTK